MWCVPTCSPLVRRRLARFSTFALRLDTLFRLYQPAAYWMILICLLVKPAIYYIFGLYRRLWAYASMSELKLISLSVTVASVVVTTIITLLDATQLLNVPRLILPIDWLLSLVAIGGFRFSLRLVAEGRNSNTRPLPGNVRRMLVMGAETRVHW